MGRVYGGYDTSTTTGTYNYGKTGITMTYGSNNTAYTITSSASDKDGETLNTTAGNSKNPSVASFWTTPGNWGGTAWDTTTIWDTTNVATNGRPLLRGFTTNIQTN